MLKHRNKDLTLEPLERRVQLDGGAGTVLHSIAALSTARFGLLAASAGGEAVFAGGGVSATMASDVVDVYNAAANEWSTTALPPETGGQAVGAGRDIYFLAGSDYQEIAAYSTQSGTWSVVGKSRRASQLLNVSGSLRLLRFDRAGQQVSTEGEYIDAPAALRGQAIADGTDVFFDYPPLSYYDTLSGNTTSLGASAPGAFQIAAPIGSKLLLLDDTGAVGADTTAVLVDTITGRSTDVPVPATFAIAVSSAYSAVGDKVVFGTATLINSNGQPGAETAAVYDASTRDWSTAGPGGGPGATAVGDQAMFAGNGGLDFDPSDVVDVYTDTAPSPVLDGGTAARAKGKATVVLQNSGDADFTGPYTLQVYAIPPRQYHGAVLLGSQTVNDGLAAGDSVRFSIPISIPENAPAGTYHLVAMVKAADGTLTPFAGATENFTIKSTSSGKSTPAKASSTVHPTFSAAPVTASHIPNPWLVDASNVLE